MVTEPRESRESRELQQVGQFGAQHDGRLSDQRGDQPLLEVFDQLGKLDGWAKIAMDQLAADPQDGQAAKAAQELCRSLEQTARLHPYFARQLADVLTDRPVVTTQ